jgi:uncharacterized protein (TIGR03435 family)
MARSMSLMFEVFEASGEMTRMLSRSRLLLALVGAPLMAPPIVAQPSVASQTMVQPAARPQFEVASVKSCKEGETVPAGQGGAKGGGRSGGSVSPGTLDMPCLPVKFFIQMAYIDYANGQFNLFSSIGNRIEGAPGWIESERYRINAKADGPASPGTMRGPMLQALLEDRFKVKVHRETRELPVYALTVAKNGLKVQRTAEGGCALRDLTQIQTPPGPGQNPWCGTLRALISRTSGRRTFDGFGVTLAELSQRLAASAGRPVIDKTGITGMFDFHLQFAPDDAAPSDEPAAPSFFTALGELGLRLDPAKGPVEFLVIDRVERASEN